MGTETFTPMPSKSDERYFTHAEEKRLFDQQWVEAKQQRHHDNVRLLKSGFWRGKYFHNGVGQTKKK